MFYKVKKKKFSYTFLSFPLLKIFVNSQLKVVIE